MSQTKRCGRCFREIDRSTANYSSMGAILCDDCAAAESLQKAEFGAQGESLYAPEESFHGSDVFAAIEKTAHKKRKPARPSAAASRRSKKPSIRQSTEVEGGPDDQFDIMPSQCSKRLRKQVVELLSGRIFGAPLLFRPWPTRSFFRRYAFIALAVSAPFMAGILFYFSRTSFALAPDFDPLLLILVICASAGPVLCILWPALRRFLEQRRGYSFGDYLFESGYIVARADQISVHTWDRAECDEPEGTENAYDSLDVHTAGGDSLFFGSDFVGDRTTAARALDRFDADARTSNIAAELDDNGEELAIGSSGPIVAGFFPRLTAATVVFTIFAGTLLTFGVQAAVQPNRLNHLVDRHDEMIAALSEHDVEAHKTFEEFAAICEKFSENPGDAVAQLNEQVCDDLHHTRALASFGLDDIHRYLRVSSIKYEDVLVDRLQRVYEHRLQRLEDSDQGDPEGFIDLARRLLRLVADDPQVEVQLLIRPVISPRFEDNDDYRVAMDAETFVPEQAYEEFDMDTLEYRSTVDKRVREIRSALPFLLGPQGIEFTVPIRFSIYALMKAIFGHSKVELSRDHTRRLHMYSWSTFADDGEVLSVEEQSQLRRELEESTDFFYELAKKAKEEEEEKLRAMADELEETLAQDSAVRDDEDRTQENDQILLELTAADEIEDDEETEDEETEDEEVVEESEDEDRLIREDRFLEDYLQALPDVDQPTIVATIFTTPGEWTYSASGVTNAYSSLMIRVVIHWVEPGGDVLELFDRETDGSSSVEFPRTVDPEDEARMYRIIAHDAYQHLEKEFEQELNVVEERVR